MTSTNVVCSELFNKYLYAVPFSLTRTALVGEQATALEGSSDELEHCQGSAPRNRFLNHTSLVGEQSTALGGSSGHLGLYSMSHCVLSDTHADAN